MTGRDGLPDRETVAEQLAPLEALFAAVEDGSLVVPRLEASALAGVVAALRVVIDGLPSGRALTRADLEGAAGGLERLVGMVTRGELTAPAGTVAGLGAAAAALRELLKDPPPQG